MATAILPDDAALDVNDFPARLTAPLPVVDVPPPSRGVRLDLDEECGPIDDDGPELPDVGPDGFSEAYDDFERWNARMSLYLAGRGPLPE